MIHRTSIIEASIARIATAWATAALDALRREGRASTGSFAGTLTEAHARLGPLRADLARHGMASPSSDEIETTKREVYRRTKRAWLDLQR